MERAPDPKDRQLAAQAKLIAIVIAMTMILWMGAQWLGGLMGWNPRLVFLFDVTAMAAFIWALLSTWRIRRLRRTI